MDKVIPNAMKTYVRERAGRERETETERIIVQNSNCNIYFAQDIVLFEVYNFRDT